MADVLQKYYEEVLKDPRSFSDVSEGEKEAMGRTLAFSAYLFAEALWDFGVKLREVIFPVANK